MKTYTLSKRAIAAHLFTAGNKDVRFYLNGVYVNPASGHMVSTDGVVLLLTMHAELKDVHGCGFIMPRATLAAVIKQVPKREDAFTVEVSDRSPPMLTFRPSATASVTCEAIDGGFPTYQRVIPAEVSGQPGTYDALIVSRVGDALRTLGDLKTGQSVRLYQNGDGAAWMRLDGVYSETMRTPVPPHVAVVMPTRQRPGVSESLEAATGAVRGLLS